MRHDFPGNIRELENIIEYCFVVCRGSIIQREHLPAELLSTPQAASTGRLSRDPVSEAADEEGRIKAALIASRGNRTEAARQLGIDRTTLWRKMKRYDIDPDHLPFRA
jgi:transcriptional regulator of acetoin/glycerol metabolism